MIFNQSQIPQAINLPFNWAADYFNGTSILEYDLQTQHSNNFYHINQNNVYRFGLFGNKMVLYFDTTDGHFYLKNRRIDIAYIENNNVYNLTNNGNKKDLITYKQAYTDYDTNNIQQKSNIVSINFGYKTMFKKDSVEMFFQPIVSLPFRESAYMEIKLTSNVSMDGYLVFNVSGKERERFYAPLKANKSGQLNWTIK